MAITYTLSQIVDAVSHELGMEEGTATGGSTTTLVDTTLYQTDDDHWNHAWLYIETTTDGLAPQGEERQVSDFTASTDTLTVPKAFSATVQSGDTYELRKGESRAAIVRAINQAIVGAYPEFFEVEYDDTTLDVAEDTFKYSLPVDCMRLARVYVYEDSDLPYRELDSWHVLEDGGSKYLMLPNANNYDSGNHLRLVYQKRPAELSASTDATVVPLEWLKWESLAIIEGRRMHDGANRGELDAKLYSFYEERAERTKKRLRMRPLGTRVRTLTVERVNHQLPRTDQEARRLVEG